MSEVITRYVDVLFDGTYKKLVEGVYQYDHGLKLRVRGVPTDVEWQMQWGYRGAADSVTTIASVVDDAVVGDIPDALLMQQREAICYLYYEDTNYGITVYEVYLPLIPRLKPATGTYTPEQIEAYDQLVAELQELISNVESLNPVEETTIAPLYENLTFPVSAGQYCWYSHTLYKAKQDIISSETWTASHWDTAVIGAEIVGLKNAIKTGYVAKTAAITYDQGGLSVSSASTTTLSTRVRSHFTLPSTIVGLKVPTGKRAWVFAFSSGTYQGRYISDGTFSKSAATGVVTADLTDFLFSELSAEPYDYKVVISNTDDSDIVPADVTGINYYYRTDDTLLLAGKSADAAATGDAINDVKSAVDKTYIREYRGYVRISTGYRLAESSGYCAQNADYNLIKFPVTAGDLIYVVCDDRMQFQTGQSTPTSGAKNRVGDTYGTGTYRLIVPDTATWLVVSTPATGSTAQFFVDIPAGDSIKALQGTETQAARMAYLNWTKGDRNVNGDTYTANMSASGRIPLQNILSAYATRRTRVHAWDKTGAYLGRISVDNTLTKSSGVVSRHYLYGLPIQQIKNTFPAIYAVSFIVVPEEDETISDYRAFAQNNLSVRITHDSDDVEKWLDNAFYVPNNTTTPALKLLHISDIHANIAALDRINQKVSGLLQKIDGKICTGDMTYNVAGEIASWWDASYMTAIGNHDTREGNNWTALSVADRIAYYISPFEENWGITRPSGCSYYYKDYTSQKVRLIVLDCMLYVSGGADATAQTSWLGDTIDAAITADYHVLIAIHAPHDGAVSVPCTFSDVTATTYSGNSNICDTPQAVIDLVAEKIAAGCHFIGYLVGHTHRDGVWKATEDGTQMMYCVTCATDTLNSDQMREVAYSGTNYNASREFQYSEGAYYDAANLVIIDTAHSLIKLIRVGGADRDIYMRPRRAICFRYSDGTLMGEDK